MRVLVIEDDRELAEAVDAGILRRQRVWDEMADPFSTAVKVTMSRLRGKLGGPPVIETVARAGDRI